MYGLENLSRRGDGGGNKGELNMKRFISFVALLAIVGCVTTAQELVNTSKSKKTILLDQSYQSVYRNVLTVSRDCYAGPINLAVSNKVEGQLYGDLEFGEISFYQDNLAAMHHVYMKFAKAGDGSEVTIYAVNNATLETFERHVRGKTDC